MSTATAAHTAQELGEARGTAAALLELSKARLSALVVLTAVVGYLLGAADPLNWLRLAALVAGTTLSAFGANALNQCLEIERDRRMIRTRTRPLPAGDLSAMFAWRCAIVMAAAGPLLLAMGVNALTAGLSAACIAIYVLIYTPMKVHTTLNTLVGAVVGAIPPLMGWAAATDGLGPGGLALAAILFVWQIPHFLALAWLYRDDYARGGYRMLPLLDPDGRRTARVILLYSLMLVPVSLALTLLSVTGAMYAVAALVLGCILLALAVRLYFDRCDGNARRVFLASVIYLPLLLLAMSADRAPGRALPLPDSTLLAAGP